MNFSGEYNDYEFFKENIDPCENFNRQSIGSYLHQMLYILYPYYFHLYKRVLPKPNQ